MPDLTDDEFQYFRAYHVCLRYPHAADIYSAILNTLSMIGLVFAIMAFVDKGWLTGGLLIVYFLGANAYKMRIAPMEQTDKLGRKRAI